MKQIYFVLTNTGTVLSKIIRFFMKDEYAHISLALDKTLKPMYSFGRLNPYNPFYGGFVCEYINKGTFKRFYKTKAKVIVFDIDDKKYEKLKQIIMDVEENKKEFKFNVIGLFAIYFGIKRKKNKAFYCAEFIKYIIEEANINLDLPELIRPEDFKTIDGEVIYTGLLKDCDLNLYNLKVC